MVTYLSSFNTTTIQVLTAEVGTTLGINAPAEVIQGVSFEIFGSLQRIDTMAPLDGEEIELWVDGLFVSSMLTTTVGTPAGLAYGAYQFFHTLVDTGLHTLEVRFLGSERPGLALRPSSAFRGVGLVEPSMLPLLALLAIGGYMLLKK